MICAFIQDHNPWLPLSGDLLKSEKLSYRLWLYLRSLFRTEQASAGPSLFAVAGGNMAFRRDVLLSVGGLILEWAYPRRPTSAGAFIVVREALASRMLAPPWLITTLTRTCLASWSGRDGMAKEPPGWRSPTTASTSSHTPCPCCSQVCCSPYFLCAADVETL